MSINVRMQKECHRKCMAFGMLTETIILAVPTSQMRCEHTHTPFYSVRSVVQSLGGIFAHRHTIVETWPCARNEESDANLPTNLYARSARWCVYKYNFKLGTVLLFFFFLFLFSFDIFSWRQATIERLPNI